MAKTRRAFTLVELMMVMLIIGIVMALLMKIGPDVVRHIKIMQTRNFLMTLEMGCQRYKQVFGTYPPDGAERPAFGGAYIDSFSRHRPLANTQVRAQFYLYIALQGPKGSGWSRQEHGVAADFGPFLEGGASNMGQAEVSPDVYWPTFNDAFGTPILYLKAKTSPKSYTDHLGEDGNKKERYDCGILRAIWGGQSGIGGWQAGGMWGVYEAHWKEKMTAQYAPDAGGKMRRFPHNPDSFVLWSAGPDERFGYWIYEEENNGYDFIGSGGDLHKGTCDDITNF